MAFAHRPVSGDDNLITPRFAERIDPRPYGKNKLNAC